MLRSAIGIGSCLGVAVAAAILAPSADATNALGLVGTMAAGVLGWASGVAGNFGHQFCNRFYERAGAYSEKIWGLDKNEHIARGIRSAQIAATRELLRLWKQMLPRYDANNDDRSHAFAELLAEWCNEQGKEATIENWASAVHHEGQTSDVAALRKSFELAFGAQVDDRENMVQRAQQARVLAEREAFDDALEGALSHVRQANWSQSIRDSDGLKSFEAFFFKKPADGGGWFNLFLIAIGSELKADAEFKRLWDSVQLGGISAMLLDDIKLSGERHEELKQVIQRWRDSLENAVADVKTVVDDILVQSAKESQAAAERHREQMLKQEEILHAVARDKGVEEAPLREVLKKLGEAEVSIWEIPARLHEAADELLQLRADLARLRNDRPEFAAIRSRASALIDGGEFEAARAELRKGREAARALREEISRSEAGFLWDEARVDRLQLSYDDACAKFSEAARLDPTNCAISIELGDLWILRGSLAKAKAAYDGALSAAIEFGNERDLSVTYERIGNALVAQGKLPEALKRFRDGLAIRARLAKAELDHMEWQRDLSVSHERVGDVLVAQGNLPEALKSFRNGFAIRERLAKADPGQARWQRDLSVSYDKIGEVLVAQGNLPKALKNFHDGLAIADRLAKADPSNMEWQGDLSVSYDKIGDVLVAQGNLPEALKSFRNGLAIRDRLVKADPGNAGWQRDLSVSCDRVGDVLFGQDSLTEALKNYRDGLAIRDRLAKADPGHAGWRRNLSVSYDKIGDVLDAQHELPEALKSFRDGLAIRDRLVKAEPGNAGWQRDLSVSYYKIGDVLDAQDNLPEAMKSFCDGLAIADRLAKADPGHTGWQRDLSASYGRIGSLQFRLGQPEQARVSLTTGRAILALLVADHPGFAQWEQDLAEFDETIDAMET